MWKTPLDKYSGQNVCLGGTIDKVFFRKFTYGWQIVLYVHMPSITLELHAQLRNLIILDSKSAALQTKQSNLP